MSDHRRTKIVATVGPASRSPKMLERLISAGADVFRLNFSHGDEDSHAENIERIRAAGELMGKWVGVLGDLPGPKLRLDEVEGGFVQIESGRELTLTTDDATIGSRDLLPVGWDGLTGAVNEGDPIYLADGRVRLRALEIDGEEIRCMVEAGGRVASHQGVNLPGSSSGMPAAGADDMGWVDFAVDHEVDLLAVSFVRTAEDLEPVIERLAERHSDIPLIAKIEKPQAAEQAEEIVAAATSGIMVARGDLGIELPIEDVPATQKRLIRLAGQQSKPVITATQMLASMVTSDRPTRAEVTDVANAIYDGTDAVMLSEETAIGDHPVEAVATMDRVARATEPDLPYGDWLLNRVEIGEGDVSTSVAQGAVGSTYRLGLAAIVVPTQQRPHRADRLRAPPGGSDPRDLAAARDRPPPQPAVRRPLRAPRPLAGSARPARRLRRDRPPRGRRQAGRADRRHRRTPDQELGTNLFEIHRVPG